MPGDSTGVAPRRRWLTVTIALAVATAVGGGAYAVSRLVAGDGRSAQDELRASSDRELAPVLVPRRHRPQVVEPVAGEVGGSVPTPEQLAKPAPGAGAVAHGPDRPSSGAPSDAEVRRELGKLEEVSRRYHFDQFDFSGELLPFGSLPSGGWHQSIASTFYDYGKGIACGGVLRPEQLGVAHKSAPCGTLVTFRYGDRAIRVPVIDRGPYIPGREWDFTGATAAALGFPGLGPIEWHV